MNFRLLLEKDNPFRQPFTEINKRLYSTEFISIANARARLTAINVQDITKTENLLHAEETFMSGVMTIEALKNEKSSKRSKSMS